MSRINITGNTYPVKEQLRELGCRWDGSRKCWYTQDETVATKAKALVQPPPLYNSPPPQDLGTAEPVALAAQHGRKAVEGAKVLSFTGYGKPADPNGTIIRSRGKTYVQVAAGNSRYFSRDMLEDFDMFDDQPGYQYQRDVVEVELSDEERAADQAKADAKAAVAKASETFKAAIERIRKDGERPERVDKIDRPVGTIEVSQSKSAYDYSKIVITPDAIWDLRYNGADGDDWSYNNYSGYIARFIPRDEALVETIRGAARQLGLKQEVEKGDPLRKEIKTDHGCVYQSCYEQANVLIDWTPKEPLFGITAFTCGSLATIDDVAVVQFREEVKKNGKRHRISPKIEGRPDLLELVNLAAELKAELQTHYRQED
jgi:hypothetical protein